jgi:hypothetical protein
MVFECDQVKIKTLDTYCEQVGRRGKNYETRRNVTEFKICHSIASEIKLVRRISSPFPKCSQISRVPNVGVTFLLWIGEKKDKDDNQSGLQPEINTLAKSLFHRFCCISNSGCATSWHPSYISLINSGCSTNCYCICNFTGKRSEYCREHSQSVSQRMCTGLGN